MEIKKNIKQKSGEYNKCKRLKERNDMVAHHQFWCNTAEKTGFIFKILKYKNITKEKETNRK